MTLSVLLSYAFSDLTELCQCVDEFWDDGFVVDDIHRNNVIKTETSFYILIQGLTPHQFLNLDMTR
ncbi:hypothetical protein BGZ58_003193, partial [Dissophora ornata]